MNPSLPCGPGNANVSVRPGGSMPRERSANTGANTGKLAPGLRIMPPKDPECVMAKKRSKKATKVKAGKKAPARSHARPKEARAPDAKRVGTRASRVAALVTRVKPGKDGPRVVVKTRGMGEASGKAKAVESKATGMIEAKPALEPVVLPRVPDLANAIQKSRIFYASHHLAHLAAAIPGAGAFDDGAREAIAQAAGVGLDELVVFPPMALQRESFAALVRQLAGAPAPGLAGESQYAEPFVFQPERLKEFEARGRPTGAYVLAITSGPMRPETMGRNAAALEALLASWGCASLTAMEYLVLQRWRAEQHGDHRFDTNAPPGAQWQWLLDSREGLGTKARYAMGNWNPKLRRVELGVCGTDGADLRKGVHATRVVAARS